MLLHVLLIVIELYSLLDVEVC